MRLQFILLRFRKIIFQSTHPLRDATQPSCITWPNTTISIHAPLTGCDIDLDYASLLKGISIHAPLTGCDVLGLCGNLTDHPFQSTHPLRDATLMLPSVTQILGVFQSTHPLRDATMALEIIEEYYRDFNPRTPYGMRHVCFINLNPIIYFNPRTPYGMRLASRISEVVTCTISIHAPLTGCDEGMAWELIDEFLFQSTHPLRDATVKR